MATKERGTKARLARVLGVSPSALTQFQHEPSFPAFDKNNTAEIYAVCVWRYLTHEKKPVPTDEEFMVGDDSDGLERWRQARAAMAEIDLERVRGRVIKLDDFTEVAPALFGPLRRFAEYLRRAGNAEAMDQLAEANKEVLAGLERLYGLDDSPEATAMD